MSSRPKCLGKGFSPRARSSVLKRHGIHHPLFPDRWNGRLFGMVFGFKQKWEKVGETNRG